MPPLKRNHDGKPVSILNIDPRFNFDCLVKDWRLRVERQPIWSSEILVLEPAKSNDEGKTVFELPPNGTLLPGNSTRFHVEGIFEMANDDLERIWTPVPNTEADKVMVCTNWFEKLIQNVEVFTGSQNLNDIHNDPIFLPPYLHEMLYAHMDPELKKFLCIEDCHPGHAVVTKRADWDYEGEVWKKYSPFIFTGGKFKFTWIPMNMWPLFQNGPFVLDTECPPRAVPLSLFQMTNKVIVKWKTDNFSSIFKKKADNNKIYRFRFTDIKLAIEMGMDNPRQNPFSKANELKYLGSTTKSISEFLLGGNSYKMKMDSTVLPPSLLLFMLPGSVQGGIPKTDQIGFRKHQIEAVLVKFNQQKVYDSSANFKSQELHLDNPQNLMNHYQFPIANIPVDKKTMTFEQLADDGTKYSFPHLYIRLTPGYDERSIPFNVNFKMFTQPGVVDIEVKFKDEAPPEEGSMIICYALYNDVNAVANLKTKQIINPYNNLFL